MSKSRVNVVLSIIIVFILTMFSVVSITFIESKADSNEEVKVKEQKLPKEAKQAPLKMISYSFGRNKAEGLKGFSVEVQNTSDKPIYYARYAFIVSSQNQSEKSNGIFFPLFYNQELQEVEVGNPFMLKREALEPGTTTTLRVSDKDALVLAKYLRESNLGKVNKIELVLQVAYYNERDYWIIGEEDESEQSKKNEVVEIEVSQQREPCESLCAGACGRYTFKHCFVRNYCSQLISNPIYERVGTGFAKPIPYVLLCEAENGTIVSHILCQLDSCSTQN